MMFEWQNKFSNETLWYGEYGYDYGEVDRVVKVNNQYFATLDGEAYQTHIKLTKKEDKITKMTCSCKSKKKKCKHLATTLFYIENEEIDEMTFKHNSNTKYTKLSEKKLEQYLEEDIDTVDEGKIKDFLVNVLIDYDDLLKNYFISFKNKLN